MVFFRMSRMSEAEPIDTIRVRKPIRSIGALIDIDGNEWDVRAVTAGGVSACRKHQLHSYYTDTSGQSFSVGTTGSGMVSQTWDAYRVEVVSEAG